MGVIERGDGSIRSRLAIGPLICFVAAAIGLGAIRVLAGPSALLIAVGIVGIAATAVLTPPIWRLSQYMSAPGGRLVPAVWLLATLGLSASFIGSGIAHGVRVGSEARGTVEAIALAAVWYALTRLVPRAGAAFRAAATLALCEVGRLLAFGIRPGITSFLLWIICLAVAILTIINKNER